MSLIKIGTMLDGNHLILAGFLTMRELHKPVHPRFIFNRDWVMMSKQEREKAIAEGKVRIPSNNEFRKMKPNEFKEWKASVQPILDELHDGVLSVFNSFPKSLLLVCRLVNPFRAVFSIAMLLHVSDKANIY